MKRILTLAALLACGAAYATDGVIEINHARALAGGITPGDTPGYPVTISQAGSYRLTSNLSQPDPDTDVIQISHDNVTLDLNGFTISGSDVCTLTGIFPSQGVNCSQSMNTGAGVRVSGGNVSVVNGHITGMSDSCIAVTTADPGTASRVENVRVSHCGYNGIRLSNGSVTRSAATFCGDDGVYVGTGEVSAVFAEANGGRGIFGNRLTVTTSTVRNNMMSGIVIYDTGIVSGSTATGNSVEGISFGDASVSPPMGASGTVSGNSVRGNGGIGIYLDTGTASGNVVDGNVGRGISIGSSGTVTGNTVQGNSIGIAVAGNATVVGNTVSSWMLWGLTAAPGAVVTASQNTTVGNPGSCYSGTIISVPALSNTCNAVAW